MTWPGVAANGARGAQIRADGLSKRHESERTADIRRGNLQSAAVAREQLRPQIEGELIESGLVDAKSAPAKAPGIGIVRRKESGAMRGVAGGRGLVDALLRLAGSAGQRGRDEGAGADTTFKKALGEELRVGVEDREAGDFQLGGESAAGGNLLAGGEVAAENGLAKTGVDLAMEGRGGLAVDGDDGDDSGGNVDHEQAC
jgi:hypothetical protein